MRNKPIIGEHHCDGCGRTCRLATRTDIVTWLSRPEIDGKTIYNYTDANNTRHNLTVRNTYAAALRLAYEIAELCPRNRFRTR